MLIKSDFRFGKRNFSHISLRFRLTLANKQKFLHVPFATSTVQTNASFSHCVSDEENIYKQ